MYEDPGQPSWSKDLGTDSKFLVFDGELELWFWFIRFQEHGVLCVVEKCSTLVKGLMDF